MAHVCPENQRQVRLKKIMFVDNKTFVEAKQIVDNNNKQQGSYANITSLTTQIQQVTKELDKLREQNRLN